MNKVTVSIVSHNHGSMVTALLKQLVQSKNHIEKIIITQNVSEDVNLFSNSYPFKVIVLKNSTSKGFGANHNKAFQYCRSQYFCVMNPDLMIIHEPFGKLISNLASNQLGVIAPMVVSPAGEIEDSARYFPTPWGLVGKILGRYDGNYPRGKSNNLIYPDWIAGMFLLFPSKQYRKLSGFDEKFFLYYEDVDLCLRAWEKKLKVALCKDVCVMHDARRTSHKNIKFLNWHLKSALRFFYKHLCTLPDKIDH